jgi:gas vesicle protein
MDTDRMLNFAIGLLSGSLVGAAAVMLFTPQSGSDLRHNITAKYQEILESGKQAMTDRRQALEAEYKAHIQIPLHAPEE